MSFNLIISKIGEIAEKYEKLSESKSGIESAYLKGWCDALNKVKQLLIAVKSGNLMFISAALQNLEPKSGS